MIKIIPILLGVLGSYVVAVIFDRRHVRLSPHVARSGLDRPARPAGSSTVFGLFDAAMSTPACSLTAVIHHRPAVPCHHGRAHRRHVRHLLHRASATTSPTPACTAPCWATAWPPPWPPSSARLPTPPTAKTPACWPSAKVYDPARHPHRGSAGHRSSPSARSSRPSSPPCPPPPSAASSLVLYGMISAVGVRNVVENKVDFTKSRNVIVAALILVLVHRHQLLRRQALSMVGVDQPLRPGCRLHRRHRRSTPSCPARTMSSAKTSRATNPSTSSFSKRSDPYRNTAAVRCSSAFSACDFP